MKTDFNFYLFKIYSENENLTRTFEFDLANNAATSKLCIIPYVNATKTKPTCSFYSLKNIYETELRHIQIKENKPIKLKSKTTKKNYIKKVNALKNHIQQGNVYELNFCIEFFADNVEIDPTSIFIKLNQLTKAPYCNLVKLNNDFIISASPELFLKKEGNTLSTKPIKGTIKRSNISEEDELLKLKLYNSIKERTENVMAVDVARNDLSIIAKKGTVAVNKLYNIETFKNVHQMVSTVSCELKKNTNFETIINATFPMASMTGAPKISAMKLISEFEDFNRNYYSGAMGLLDEKNDFELSVIIRSIFYNQQTKRLSIAVGSAITHLCDAEIEYEECLLKANALLTALNATII